jgi:predicted enzyme involved in methoxymalonyl-ACP biosynthesis
VADKFGDNGITGCIIIDGTEIDTLLLSCRILGKGIEHAFLKKVLLLLHEDGVEKVNASYLPTLKNKQVSDFYDKNGFVVLSEDSDGAKQYAISLTDADLKTEDYYRIIIK